MTLAGLLLAATAASAGLFSGSNQTPALWVPPEDFKDWAKAEAVLQESPASLTVALTPAMITPEAKALLSRFPERLEPALRLEGDPILPLLAKRPFGDPAERIADAKERFRVALGSAPAGFVPGGGAVAPELFPAFKAMGLKWVATAEYEGSSVAWAQSGGVVLAPVPPLESLDALPKVPTAPIGALARDWAANARPAAKVRDWPTWLGGYEAWESGPRAKRAWPLYEDAARAVESYQNSGSADLKALEDAAAQLYAAQAARHYRELPPAEADADFRAFRGQLQAVYRKLKQTPPESLFAAAASQPGAADEQSTDVHVSQGDDWLEIANPAGSLAKAPAGLPPVAGPPAERFKLERLRVESTGAGTVFTFKVAKLDTSEDLTPPPSAAPELGRLLLEAYLDVNRVPRAGATALLSDRVATVRFGDAWEYALTISAWGAYLYRANPLGAPQPAGRLAASVDAKRAEVRVTVPRSLLAGNPLRWGYIATAAAADPATAGKPFVRPVRPEQGSSIMSVLAPLEQQKALLEAAPSARPRLSAVRLSR